MLDKILCKHTSLDSIHDDYETLDFERHKFFSRWLAYIGRQIINSSVSNLFYFKDTNNIIE